MKTTTIKPTNWTPKMRKEMKRINKQAKKLAKRFLNKIEDIAEARDLDANELRECVTEELFATYFE